MGVWALGFRGGYEHTGSCTPAGGPLEPPQATCAQPAHHADGTVPTYKGDSDLLFVRNLAVPRLYRSIRGTRRYDTLARWRGAGEDERTVHVLPRRVTPKRPCYLLE